MSTEPLTSEVSNRICSHMNIDHKEAVLSFAKYYGGIVNPIEAEMTEINSHGMTLLVDGKNVEISFDHTLLDSNDAHKTLVAMSKKIS